MERELRNVLIVKLSAIGDVIHALPVSYAIKETFPTARITWVVEPPSFDLLSMNPCVDKIILFQKKEFKSFRGFAKKFFPFKRELQSERYDAVLDLQGLFKSAAIAFFARSNIKLGMCNMRELSDRVSKPVVGKNFNGHIVERYLDTARAIGCRVEEIKFPIEIPEDEARKAQAIFEHEGARFDNPFVVMAIGANWPNKRWGEENFAELADWFYGLGVIPVMVGAGVVDAQRAQAIAKQSEIPPVNLIGKTNWKQLAHIIKNARLVIGGDTGVVHLAAGLGVRTVMLMGPTDANRNGPYGQIKNAIEVDRTCKFCWKRACPKGDDCLERITVKQVERKILSLQ